MCSTLGTSMRRSLFNTQLEFLIILENLSQIWWFPLTTRTLSGFWRPNFSFITLWSPQILDREKRTLNHSCVLSVTITESDKRNLLVRMIWLEIKSYFVQSTQTDVPFRNLCLVSLNLNIWYYRSFALWKFPPVPGGRWDHICFPWNSSRSNIIFGRRL